MSDALASYVVFKTASGNDANVNLQNFYAEQNRSYQGRTFAWAGFGYTGSTVSLSAANTEAQLVFAVTPVTVPIMQQAYRDRWLVEVSTVWLDPDTLTETSNRLVEVYAAVGLQSDGNRLALQLGSPLDAQAEEIPSRVLTRKLVGQLPATGQLSLI